MAIDVEAVDIDAAHRHIREIRVSERGTLKARSDEFRAFELVRSGIRGHRTIIDRRQHRGNGSTSFIRLIGRLFFISN